ncbi:TetR/AcrR family transcriptional regulator [Actinomadura sp. WMMB 499]|uniref:TetR/AcrR family transcriptional regulator n=1 Tax=Actinomadura sp. WMMB 499 TaxID=1219491 RepID=UPI00124501F4|nr:TetR/AcrR family transcriptional regulator [Actinomadura sp. WMMB 499]QFG20767.1 TetR family transcriptional regulator [Actinomadura sp. WMMB 499]
MPRTVDKQARRRDVADALFRIAAREGLDGVSMRTVATEAGFSLGAVQRYFQTKDEMLSFAFARAAEAARARLAAIRAEPDGRTFPEELRRAMLGYLPADESRLAEARIWAAFHAEAAVRPAFADALNELDAEARANLRAAIAAAQETGGLPAGRPAEELAELILVLLDGLWWSAVRRPPGAPLTVQRDVIDTAIAMLTAR